MAAAAPAEPQGAGPLWRARQLLDQELERGRRRLAQGLPVRAARLAHLRLTQDALEQIDRGHLRRASDLLERAIAADGETGFAYLYLGKLYLDRGLTEEGLLLLERAAALLPRDRELERELRRLRAQAGESLTEPARSGG
ncbi:MAG: hypothetical protein D6815_05790 [Candidatus Dadabacteria bacterium]|nr:MAG: hypothetical protein D6815_05790 [Candidatus Dadabacteria bacterium]